MQNKILLEIGMSNGKDTKKLYEKFKLPLYGFEPVPYLYTMLKDKFKHNPDIVVSNEAIDIEDSVKNFYISNPEGFWMYRGQKKSIHPYGCSSLYNFSDDIHQKWIGRPDFNVSEKITVNTLRLETFLDKHNFQGEIIYMHCDAQGNDLNVLISLGKYLEKVKSGKIEVAAQTELYKSTNNTYQNAAKFLTDNNFVIKTPLGLNNHETDIEFFRKGE